MALPRKKLHKTERIRTAEIGADGRTIGDRLREAMLDHHPPYDPENDQTRLAADCQALWATGRKNAPVKIKQQHIGELLHNKQSSSKYIPIIAEVLGVRGVWLQFGITPKHVVDPDPERERIRQIVNEVLAKKEEKS